jgi:iron(III) transport system permease protein
MHAMIDKDELLSAPPKVVTRISETTPAPPLVKITAIVISLFMLLPLGYVVWATVDTGWSQSVTLIFRPRVADLTINTVLLVVCTIPVCMALAIALAWLTERTNLPFARIWAWTAIAPLAIPAFVHSYAWVSFAPGLEGLPAGVLISVLAYFPFLYLPVASTLRRLDPALEDQAASLGLPPWKIWLRVVLPQLRVALCGGSLLIGLHLLAEYGLYVMIRFDTFTTAIVDQFQSTYSGSAANMLAGVLVMLSLMLLGTEFGLRGNRRFARLGPGAARIRDRIQLGWWMAPALALPVLLALLSIGVPLLTIGEWLLAGGSEIWKWDEIGTAFYQTATLAVVGGVLTTLVAIPAAWLSIRAPGRLSRLIESCNYLTSALPGVVVALALVTITVRVAHPFYQTAATILLAYMIMFLPRALISLRAGLAQAPVELEWAAGSLGRSPINAFWTVTIRLAAPGAAAGVALSALGIMNELTATQMLAPNGTRTLAMAFWALSGEIDYAGAAPYAVLMILSSLPLTLILYHQSKRMAGR